MLQGCVLSSPFTSPHNCERLSSSNNGTDTPVSPAPLKQTPGQAALACVLRFFMRIRFTQACRHLVPKPVQRKSFLSAEQGNHMDPDPGLPVTENTTDIRDTVPHKLSDGESRHEEIRSLIKLSDGESRHQEIQSLIKLSDGESRHEEIRSLIKLSDGESRHEEIRSLIKLSDGESRHQEIQSLIKLSDGESRHEEIRSLIKLSDGESRHEEIRSLIKLSGESRHQEIQSLIKLSDGESRNEEIRSLIKLSDGESRHQEIQSLIKLSDGESRHQEIQSLIKLSDGESRHQEIQSLIKLTTYICGGPLVAVGRLFVCSCGDKSARCGAVVGPCAAGVKEVVRRSSTLPALSPGAPASPLPSGPPASLQLSSSHHAAAPSASMAIALLVWTYWSGPTGVALVFWCPG
ncbi:unnamed protein product [Boreogadus saida]